MNRFRAKSFCNFAAGFTLIELVIVVATMAILMMVAVPSYRQYMLRVQRGEAVNMLTRASMCQERVYARLGRYDTNACLIKNDQKRYQLSYQPKHTRGQAYIAIATPLGAQKKDRCGSLSLDQSGNRKVNAADISVMQCWNGR